MDKKATFGQRFVAVLIDFLIIGVACYLISLLLQKIGLITIPAEPDCLKQIQEGGFDFSSEEGMSVYQECMKSEEYIQYSKRAYLNFIINLSVFSALFLFYFVLLPLLWKKGQTVGRFAMQISVVDKNGKEPSVGVLLGREALSLLFNEFLNCCCCIPLIINIVFLCGQNKTTIHDKIMGTKMYQNKLKNIDTYSNNDNDYNEDFIDGDAKVVSDVTTDDDIYSDIDNK